MAKNVAVLLLLAIRRNTITLNGDNMLSYCHLLPW
jgi:hypothetical protein